MWTTARQSTFYTAASPCKVPGEIPQQSLNHIKYLLDQWFFFFSLLFDIFQTFYYQKCHQVMVRLRLLFLKAVRDASKCTESECRGMVPTQIGGTCSPLVIFYLEKASAKGRSGFAGAKTVLVTCATVRRRLGREGCKIIAFHRRFNLLELGR